MEWMNGDRFVAYVKCFRRDQIWIPDHCVSPEIVVHKGFVVNSCECTC